MKKLLCYFYVVVLSVALCGCKGGDGGDNTSTTSQEVNIPNNISGPNVYLSDSRNTLRCKRNDALSTTCCQYAKVTGDCKCYSCNKSHLTGIDLSSECSPISSMSASECINFTNEEDANKRNIFAGGSSESETSKAAKYYKDKRQSTAPKGISSNPVADEPKTGNALRQEANTKNNVIQRQQVIKSNIIKYLEKKAEIKNEDLKDFIDWFKDEKNNIGNELSIHWLVGQLPNVLPKQMPQAQVQEEIISFDDVENAFYRWKEDDDLPPEIQKDFDDFIFGIYFLQHYPKLPTVVGSIGTIGLMYETMQDSLYDPAKSLLQIYKISLSMRQYKITQFMDKAQQHKFIKETKYSQDIGDILENGISDKALVFVKNGAGDEVTAAIFKQDYSNYYYYNPNTLRGEATASDVQNMASKLYEDFGGAEGVKELHFFEWSLMPIDE
jgi:hypothetical protein